MGGSDSGGAQHEIEVDFVMGEGDAAILGVVDDTGLKQGRDIAVDGFQVARATSRIASGPAPAIARYSFQRSA